MVSPPRWVPSYLVGYTDFNIVSFFLNADISTSSLRRVYPSIGSSEPGSCGLRTRSGFFVIAGSAMLYPQTIWVSVRYSLRHKLGLIELRV